MNPNALDLRRSPLTDVRSLGSSAVFHAMLFGAASLVVLQAVLPEEDTGGPLAIYGEIGPVDNRAPEPTEPGGSPGELGMTPPSASPMISASPTTPPPLASSEAVADDLIDRILASPSAAPDLSSSTPLPLPTTPDLGILPGAGGGGGGGSGGGEGGGEGKGIGAGTEFFGARERASSFAYVIDRSASMTNRGAIDMAKRELISSLRRLPPDARFGVVFYNEKPATFSDPAGQSRLMPATSQNKARLEDRLVQLGADGGTDHVEALLAGIGLGPEVIFFLTDADQMTDREADELIKAAGSIRIQAVEFGLGPETGLSVPLRTLANATGGSYRYIDVMTFPQGRVTPPPDRSQPLREESTD